jgi:PAT family beta-lactamase induction signal transducer AmpG
MLTGNGLIVIIGGYLEQEYGDKKAWSYTMICRSYYGCLNHLQLFFYTENKKKENVKVSFGAVFASFQKKQIGIVLAFILLFAWANPSY